MYDDTPIVEDIAEEEWKQYVSPPWALMLSAVCAFIIAIVGCCGNLFTILALPYSRKLRNAATWFVVNLALTEMIFCVTILPMSALHLLQLRSKNESLFDENGCKLFVFLRYVIISSEIMGIAAIAINRCILISFPKSYYKIFTKVNTIGIILSLWVFSILTMLLPLVEVFGAFSYNFKTNECDFTDESIVPRKVYIAIGYVIPCVIIVVSYSYIFYKARQSSIKMKQNAAHGTLDRPATGLRNRDMRVARVIAVIFVVFIVCCTPVSVAHYYGSQGDFPTLLLLLHPLYWLQYCLNIFLYVLMNRQYREAYINYVSEWWPNFATLTRKVYQPREEETSVSDKPSKVSIQHRINPLSPSSPKHTPHPSPRHKMAANKMAASKKGAFLTASDADKNRKISKSSDVSDLEDIVEETCSEPEDMGPKEEKFSQLTQVGENIESTGLKNASTGAENDTSRVERNEERQASFTKRKLSAIRRELQNKLGGKMNTRRTSERTSGTRVKSSAAPKAKPSLFRKRLTTSTSSKSTSSTTV